jgi:Xaa-Pro aminopeptidase
MADTFEYAIPRIKPGVTELDIQADIEGQMLRLGAEAHCIGFAPMVPSGPQNTSLSMNRNTLRKVKESEIINPASGTLYEGYNAVICTPVVLGKIPTDMKDAIKACHEVKNYQASAMKPGSTSKQLFKIYNDFLEKKGYLKYLSPYGAAHSTGLLECEVPCFQDPNLDVLMEENMAICIDAYLTGLPWGSFRIEDTYIVKKDGAELLTRFNQSYIPETFS